MFTEIKLSEKKRIKLEDWKKLHKDSLVESGSLYCDEILNRLKKHNYEESIINILRKHISLTIKYPKNSKIDIELSGEKLWQ